MNNLKISVIMPVYNGEKYLAEAIESILTQTFTDFELIIVNDGSTDSSLETIERYNDRRIKLINNSKNLGITKSLNIALKEAKGKYIARQDADDISLSTRLEEQLKYIETHPEVGVVGTNVYNIQEDGTISGSSCLDPKPTLEKLLKDNRIIHGSIMMGKRVIEEVGYYDDAFRISQDYELWLRISKNYEIRNIKNPLYKLRAHKKRITIVNLKEATLEVILAVRMAKNHPNADVGKSINDEGILKLYDFLSLTEKAAYHKRFFFKYMRNRFGIFFQLFSGLICWGSK